MIHPVISQSSQMYKERSARIKLIDTPNNPGYRKDNDCQHNSLTHFFFFFYKPFITAKRYISKFSVFVYVLSDLRNITGTRR